MKRYSVLGKILFILFIFCISCKTSEPEFEFIKPSERTHWQSKIESGAVGFYDNRKKVTANIDQPPRVRDKKTLRRAVEITQPCLEYLVNNTKTTKKGDKKILKRSAKVEFLVDEKGKAGHFYLLNSAGDCDRTLVESIGQATFIPATSDNKPKPTLVHFTMKFYLQGQSMTIRQVSH